jgi:hypothetical protein
MKSLIAGEATGYLVSQILRALEIPLPIKWQPAVAGNLVPVVIEYLVQFTG